MSWYVVIDCNKVQEFVFSSSRLREICNASSLLDELESRRIPDIVKGYGGSVIRSCGGVVLAEFNSAAEAKDFELKAQASYRQIGVSTTSIRCEMNGVQDDNFFDTALESLFDEMQDMKSQSRGTTTEPSTILAVPCEASGIGNAECIVSLPEGSKRYSGSAAIKRKGLPQRQRKKDGTVHEYLEYYGAPDDFSDLVTWGVNDLLQKIEPGTSESRFMGIMFADVNGLGSLTRHIAKEREVYQDFSVRLAKEVDKSLVQAVNEVLEPEILVRQAKTPKEMGCLPFNVLYMGGDDLAIVIQAKYAFDVTIQLLEKFKKNTSGLMEEVKVFNDLEGDFPPHLTMSAGLVLAPYNYPIQQINRLGRELESRAKAAGRASAPKPSLIDFCVIKNDAAGSLADLRRTKIIGGDRPLLLYGGPYDCPGMKKLIEAARIVRNEESGVPKGKLKELVSILHSHEGSREQEYGEWFGRLSEDSKKTMNSAGSLLATAPGGIPERDDRTGAYKIAPIVDAIEIMDFI